MLSERFQLSAESISHVTARDLTIGGAIQSMNLYSIDSNQTSNVQGQLIFSTARLSTSPPSTINSLSGSLVIVSNSSLNLASRLGVHFESAGGVLIQSSSWVATTDPFGLGEADLRITVDQSSTQKQNLTIQTNSTLISSGKLQIISTRPTASVSDCSIQAPSTLLSVSDFSLDLPCSVSNSLSGCLCLCLPADSTIRMEADTSFAIGKPVRVPMGMGHSQLLQEVKSHLSMPIQHFIEFAISLSGADFVWDLLRIGCPLKFGLQFLVDSSLLTARVEWGPLQLSRLTSDQAVPKTDYRITCL